jgi:hypothetical protein
LDRHLLHGVIEFLVTRYAMTHPNRMPADLSGHLHMRFLSKTHKTKKKSLFS